MRAASTLLSEALLRGQKTKEVIYIYSLARVYKRYFSWAAYSTRSMGLNLINQPETIHNCPICINKRLFLTEQLCGDQSFQFCASCVRGGVGADHMDLTSPCLCRARLPSASNSLRTSFTFKLQSGDKGARVTHRNAPKPKDLHINHVHVHLSKKTEKICMFS